MSTPDLLQYRQMVDALSSLPKASAEGKRPQESIFFEPTIAKGSNTQSQQVYLANEVRDLVDVNQELKQMIMLQDLALREADAQFTTLLIKVCVSSTIVGVFLALVFFFHN